MNDKWLAWERYGRSRRNANEKYVVARLESEGQMTGFQLRGEATPEEIAAEVARRAERDASAAAEKSLREHPAYSDAQAIKDRLEFIIPANHPLDALTPEEWSELRRKIVGAAGVNEEE